MMFPTVFLPEIWLQVLDLLSTRDLITLSLTCKYIYAVAEHERKKRQGIDQLLSVFVNDVDNFRQLMRKTGSVLVGNFAAIFFTKTAPEMRMENKIELFFLDSDLETCLRLWFSFFTRESEVSDQDLSIVRYEDERVCSLVEI